MLKIGLTGSTGSLGKVILRYNKNILKNYDYVFLGAWNFKKEIINKEKKFVKKGLKFITHIPYPRILG